MNCVACDTPIAKTNTIYLDFAVLSQSYKSIKIDVCQSHVINLDPIYIDIRDFLTIFYPFGDSFGINLQQMSHNKHLLNYISFIIIITIKNIIIIIIKLLFHFINIIIIIITAIIFIKKHQ